MFAPLIGYFCALCAVLTIGPTAGYDPNSTGTLRVLGLPIGAYVDNEQPNQCQSVLVERATWPVVVAGQAPYSSLSCPGAIMAKEWYAWGCDYRDMRRPPRAQAYVLQWRFAWRGCRPPGPRQRARLLALVERWNPLLVLWF